MSIVGMVVRVSSVELVIVTGLITGRPISGVPG